MRLRELLRHECVAASDIKNDGSRRETRVPRQQALDDIQPREFPGMARVIVMTFTRFEKVHEIYNLQFTSYKESKEAQRRSDVGSLVNCRL